MEAQRKEKTFVYYRCNRKKPSTHCQQAPISQVDMEEQIDEMLSHYDVIPEFAQLYDEIVADCRQDEPANQEQLINTINRDITKLRTEMSNLTKLACKNLINDDEFTQQKNNYHKQILKLEQKIKEIIKGKNTQDEILDNISLMMRAKKRFLIGTIEEKKDIIRSLGSNRVLKDKILLITANKWGGYFEMLTTPYADDFATLELTKTPVNTKQNPALTGLVCELRNGRDSNPRPPA